MTSYPSQLAISGSISPSEFIKIGSLPSTSVQGTFDTTSQKEMMSGDLGGQVIKLPFLSFAQETSQSVQQEHRTCNKAAFYLAISFACLQRWEGEVLQ
jgi:hypothetical protein